MVRERHKTRSTWRGRLLGLALINILPLAGLAWLGWALATDRVSMRDLPDGLARNGALFGVAVLLLFLVASLLLPFVHAAVKALARQLGESRYRRAEGGGFRRLVEWLLWPFRTLLHALLWLVRLLLMLTSFALIAAALLFLVRMFAPEIGEDWLPIDRWIDDGTAWLRQRF